MYRPTFLVFDFNIQKCKMSCISETLQRNEISFSAFIKWRGMVEGLLDYNNVKHC